MMRRYGTTRDVAFGTTRLDAETTRVVESWFPRSSRSRVIQYAATSKLDATPRQRMRSIKSRCDSDTQSE